MNTSGRAQIGLFYGSSTCYTEIVGEKIRAQIGEANVDIFNISDEPIATALYYDLLIMGIPTWDYGELQEDWEEIWDELDELDFSGKVVALYGLGDQVGYPEWFLDAMGYLHHKLVKLGAQLVGYWPSKGYEFEASKALTDDEQFFVGLALDEENEFAETDTRIAAWCDQVLAEFGQ
ncbi:flavodoxin FldB [Teredinibacter franksiae]|uniref:flavodoxin FldB n=1 Tax=Teredinibacter franksiae TaxID=2761453 RepID=UPI001627C466|nr:flavodoxin FldB [Teredinibacter franksiae]